MSRNRIRPEHLWRVYIGLGLVAIGLDIVVSGNLAKHLVYDALGLSAAAAMIYGVRRWRPRQARPWYLFAAGQVSFVLGDSIRAYYESILRVEAPLYSVADAFYLLAYPLLAAGLLALIRSRDPSRDRSSLIDATIVAVSVGVIAWFFLMRPYANDPDLGLSEKLISLAYPIADVVLVSFAARLAIGPGVRTRAYYLLGASILTLLVADSWYAVMLLDGTYQTGSPPDTGFLLSYMLWGAAALHPSMSRLSEPSPNPELRVTRRRLALLAAASLVAPAVRGIEGLRGSESEDIVVTLSATVILFALVLIRMSGLVNLLSETLGHQQEAESRRRRSEDRFRSLVQNSSDVITVTDVNDRILYQSPSVAGVLGYAADELIGRKLTEFLHPEDVDQVETVCRSLIESSGRDQARIEFRWRHRNGNWIAVEATVGNSVEDPSVQGLVFNTRDVSERKELEEQLTHQAFHDPLTDLANRSLFRDRVEHALALRKSLEEPISVLFLDVDDFKTVNDSLGHQAGDELLLEVADRIRSCLRDGDTGARLGGDEFAVLLEDGNDPPAVADRLIEAFKGPFRIHGKELTATVSIGISRSAFNNDGADELLRNADAAMYAAKGRGKGFYEFFEQDMHTTALRRLHLEGDLRRAVHRKEFRVHYQPIVGLASGRVAGFEALVRWAHPSRGLLSPGDFIGVAEETGMIVPIGRTVLKEACRQAKTWQTQHPSDPLLSINVNLSAEQLEAPDLVRDVKAALRQSGLAADSLVLEITETVLMRDTTLAVARLEKLKALGVRLAIDDFGTGFSSLSYLQHLPCDSLKIPKPFLDGIGDGEQATSLVRGIIELGRTLGLTIVAEGVEQARQWEALEELRCDLVQGYYFARPQSAERIEALLRRQAMPSAASANGARREPALASRGAGRA